MANLTRADSPTSGYADCPGISVNRDGCMTAEPSNHVYGKGARMLTLAELCEWLNITERHARKLVERDAIPYRKVGRLLRFPEAEIEEWSHPVRRTRQHQAEGTRNILRQEPKGRRTKSILPRSLIE
jgi:excisionase family DNA binding protein